MSAPETKLIFTSQQPFPDGSVAGRWEDTMAWRVITGVAGDEENTDNPICQAAGFCSRQNTALRQVFLAEQHRRDLQARYNPEGARV